MSDIAVAGIKMASVNIALEVFAFIVSALLFVCFSVEDGSKTRQSKLLLAMIAVNALCLMSDAAAWYCTYPSQREGGFIDYALNYSTFFLSYVQVTLYTVFVLGCITSKKRIHRVWFAVNMGLGVLFVGLLVFSAFNNVYFVIDNGRYIRQPLYWIHYVYPIVVLFIDSVIVSRNFTSIGAYNVVTLLMYSVLPLIAAVLQMLFYGLSLIYLALTLALLQMYLVIHVRKSRQLNEKETELSRLTVSVMLSQIQPHFVYNILTAIRTFVTEEPHKAERAIAEFSDFLRGNLDSLNSVDMIPFEQELNHTKHYLELEKMRFEERLTVVYDICAVDFTIPSLTLQPIVENAVRHGITAREQGEPSELRPLKPMMPTSLPLRMTVTAIILTKASRTAASTSAFRMFKAVLIPSAAAALKSTVPPPAQRQ